MVSGLVCLELMKVAAEKATFRLHNSDEQRTFSNFDLPSATRSHEKKSVNQMLFSLGGNLKRLFAKATKLTSSSSSSRSNSNSNSQKLERERILGRFRNSFINLDGPVMTHAEPSAAEEISIASSRNEADGGDGERKSFTLWDSLQVSVDCHATVRPAELWTAFSFSCLWIVSVQQLTSMFVDDCRLLTIIFTHLLLSI
jgi:hypothetical protein